VRNWTRDRGGDWAGASEDVMTGLGELAPADLTARRRFMIVAHLSVR
jgi:hypothetical protein